MDNTATELVIEVSSIPVNNTAYKSMHSVKCVEPAIIPTKIPAVSPANTPTVRTIVPSPVTAKKRVAGYARVSTDLESQEGSYELQCRHYTEYINKHNEWTLVKVYADEGKTGTSTRRRTEFCQMIADAEEGKIDLIITKSISRFARNTVDCLETVRKLKNLPKPVGVYFEKENIDSLDGKSELILTILSSLAQDESRSISENIKWSLQKLYAKGYVHCPTYRLLGYDTVIDYVSGEKHMVIEPVGASVVKMIFNLFLNGAGYSEIAHRVEQMGARTGAGKTKWSPIAIQRILENEKYVGDVITQKGFTRDFLTHERARNEGQLPQYIAEGHHEAIIDRDSWITAQKRIKAGLSSKPAGNGPTAEKTQKNTRYSDRTVFSSKLYCGNCGGLLIRRSTSTTRQWHGSNRYYIWRCRNAEGRGDKSCSCGSIPELVLEQSFMEMLTELSARPMEELKEEFKLANGVSVPEQENAEELKLKPEMELKNIESQMETSIKTDFVLYDEMFEELETRKTEIEDDLHMIPDWVQLSPLKTAAFDWFIEQLDGIRYFDATKSKISFRADIFSRCVEKGEVREVRDGDKLIDIAIRYTFTCGLEAIAYGNKCSIATARKKADEMNSERS